MSSEWAEKNCHRQDYKKNTICEWNVEFYLISVLVIQSQVQLANVRDEYLRICFGFRRNDADERKIREKEKNFTAWW